MRILPKHTIGLCLLLVPVCVAGTEDNASLLPDYQQFALLNTTAYIPPQCYSNSVADDGQVSNPCYACHTEGKRPNVLNDSDTQLNFTFPRPAQTNPWKNLFVDRRAQIAAIDDADILAYVQQDNYRDAQGNIKLVKRITENLAPFDVNGNGKWDGYLPDANFNFDERGFDRNIAGDYSGWRSFAYYPFLGTFMPSNGSTDDVLIRLPRTFQTDESGIWSAEIYTINLAIVEAMIKEKNIAIAAVDETTVGVDLNKNGKLDIAYEIVYDWAPLEHRTMSYVGAARRELEQKHIHIAAKMYPEGTEFLHTVRYLDVTPDGEVRMAKRMKELRYSRKVYWANYYDHQTIASKEIKERHDFPDREKTIVGTAEEGVVLNQVWRYQGFIEDAQGELRPQSFEEHAFCAGCHGGTGSMIDSSFAFYRKFPVDQFQQGWYHWSQKALKGIPEPKRESDGEYEYSFYLVNNPTGDEYGANREVFNKFFTGNHQPKQEAFEQLHEDISYLLMPSAERALALNKAYKLVVDEQSFALGRDAILAPINNLHTQVDDDQETGVKQALNYF